MATVLSLKKKNTKEAVKQHNMTYKAMTGDRQYKGIIGGGDSFSAGLIYALETGMTPSDALEFATAASCLKHTMEGDYNRSTAEEIQNLLKTGGNGRVQR